MKKSFLAFLSMAFCFGIAAKAEVSAYARPDPYTMKARLQHLAYSYGKIKNSTFSAIKSRRIEERLKASESSSKMVSLAGTTLKTLGHQGQALVLIMIISGVEIVRQEIAMSNLKKQDLNMAEIISLAGKAADHILLGGETWSSIAGSISIGGLAHKPLQVVNQIINNSNSKPVLKSLLQSGIVSSVTL